MLGEQIQSFHKLFERYFFAFVEYLCNRSHKMRTKSFKNFISIPICCKLSGLAGCFTSFNPILHGVFDQLILHGGHFCLRILLLHQTPWEHQISMRVVYENFSRKLILSWWRHGHSLRNDVIFCDASQAVPSLYIGLVFDTESQTAQVKLVTSQKLMKSYEVIYVLAKNTHISESDFTD